MKRRGNNQGSVYWSASDNRYVGQATLPNGKRKKVCGTRGDKSRAARLGVEERLAKYIGRRGTRDGSEQLQAFVARWIETAPIRENTRDQYRWMARHLGKLGAKSLVEIEPVDVRRHLDSLEVGDRTRRGVYTLLHRVLGEAAQLEMISRNPATNVTAPRMPKGRKRPLTPPEVGYLLEAVAGDRLEALIYLALTSTMGPAEMLALRRKDLDLTHRCLWVVNDLVTPSAYGYRPTLEPVKTEKRRRRINLLPSTVEALRERLKLCLAEGSGEFVFTTAQGGLIRPSSLRHYWWKPLLLKAAEIAHKGGYDGFPTTLRLYDLRHTANALLGLSGVPIEIASAWMGHGSIKTTHDVYGHIYAQRFEEAVERFNSLFSTLLPRKSLPTTGKRAPKSAKKAL